MAAINVVLNGAFTSDTGTSVGTFVGQMAYSDRGVGGGPVLPPAYPAHPIAPGGERPEHPIAPGGERPAHPIAPGGPPPRPEHPIALPPPTVWPPGPGIDHPEHPIVIPDPDNPIPPGTLVTWKPYWSEETGWIILGVPNVPHPAPG